MGTSSQDHLPLYRELRTLLRNGQWRQVVEVLEDLCEGKSCAKEIRWTIELPALPSPRNTARKWIGGEFDPQGHQPSAK